MGLRRDQFLNRRPGAISPATLAHRVLMQNAPSNSRAISSYAAAMAVRFTILAMYLLWTLSMTYEVMYSYWAKSVAAHDAAREYWTWRIFYSKRMLLLSVVSLVFLIVVNWSSVYIARYGTKRSAP